MRTETVVSADGTRISYEVHGSGRPVVIVPGTLAPPSLYHPLAEPLSGRHQVVIVERRGYGSSEPGPRPCRISYHVADLVAVLSTLDEPATVFGHSFGGLTALEAAGSELIRGLALYEPPSRELGEQLLPALEKGRAAVAAGRPADAVAAMLIATESVPGDDEEMITGIANALASRAEGVLSDLECVTTATPDMARWAKIAVPTLLMCGGESPELDRNGIVALHEALPHARYEELPGQTHFPEDMRLVADLLEQL